MRSALINKTAGDRVNIAIKIMTNMYKILTMTFCLSMVAFTSKTMAQTFNHTDASGVTWEYTLSGSDGVSMGMITNLPATLTKWIIPDVITHNGTETRKVTLMGSSAFYDVPLNSTLKEIVFPKYMSYIDAAGLYTGNPSTKVTNLHKLTFGEAFNGCATNCFEGQPLDTIIFKDDAVITRTDVPCPLSEAFGNCPATTKVIVPCGKLEAFRTNFTTYTCWQGEGAKVTWTTVNFYEAECLDILTVLSNDNSLGNVWSMNGGQIITSTPTNTSATYSGTATLIAISKENIVFTGWNDGNTDNPRIVSVSSDTTFTAKFVTCNDVGTENIMIQKNKVNIYPNPANNTLHIESSFNVEQIIIYDINGKMLKQIANPSQEINVSDLATGIYLVKVKTTEGEIVKKVVKE